jgi:6-pyruvoyltetrahydropterin/6-carboxytetrahydropterin synthase
MGTRLTAVRRIQFAAGHRVFKHESKCANFHGHNYVAHFFAEASRLDMIGRVIDFSVLKERIGGWVDAKWDHGFLVYEHDFVARDALSVLPVQKIFFCAFNPTAEEMANYLLWTVCPEVLRDTGVTIYRVEIEETENCRAIAERVPEED